MTDLWSQVSLLLGIAILCAHVLLVAYVVWRVLLRKTWPPIIAQYMQKYGMLAAALIGWGAVLGSLFIAYVIGIPTCPLCWFQRTMIYPSAIIATVAWLDRDLRTWRYIVPLAVIGGLIGLYQHIMQIWPSLGLACGSTATTSECAVRYLFEFGYITLPLLGITVCAMIGILALEVHILSKRENEI